MPQTSSATARAGRAYAWRPSLAAITVALGLALLPSATAAAETSPTVVVDDASTAGAYLAGRFALAEGQFATAADGLGRAVALAPDDFDLRNQVMVLEVAGGEIDRALDDARRLVEVSTGNRRAEARLVLAVAAWRDREPDAVDQLRALEDGTVPGVIRPLLLAWAEPDPVEAAARLAAIDTQLGELLTLHRALLLDGADEPAAALQALAVEDRDPTELSDRALVTQARLLARLGDVDRGLALVDAGRPAPDRSDLVRAAARALEAGDAPASIVASPGAGMADAFLGVAELLRTQDRLLNATFYTRLALELAPDYAPGWLTLGALLHEQGGPGIAIQAFSTVDRNSPWSRTARIETADARFETGDVDGAVEQLRELVDDDPTDSRSAVALGDVLRRAERFDEAADSYALALERSGGPEAPLWRLHYAHGIALERSRRWPEAERALQKALALEPEQPFVLNYLGYSWVDQGLHLDEAKAMLYRAVELRPNDGFIVDSLGWAYYRLSEYNDAVVYLERAVELEPGDPVINDHLGDAYWRVGRHREAEFQWRRALTLDPEPETIPEIEVKLQTGLPEPDAG